MIEIPERIGPYPIERGLGRGGMGVVYLARDEAADRRVALKAVHPSLVRSEAAKDRFRHEVMMIAKLEHDSICPVYDVGEDDDQPYFTMRYVDGVPLSRLLRSGFLATPRPTEKESADPSTFHISPSSPSPLPDRAARPSGDTTNSIPFTVRAEGPQVREIIGIMAKVARALDFAHVRGVVHRDVKPSNIIVTADLKPYLMDFGLAKAIDDDSMSDSGSLVGTVDYMSPEQISGGRVRIDGRSDIFSLGVTLYELLTGQRPFRGETREQIFHEILFGKVVSPRTHNSHVSRDLETIVLKCLERSPSERYATAAALADDLGALLELRPIKARPLGFLGRTLRAARRNPAVAALAVAIVLGSGYFVYRVARERNDAEFERSLRRSILAARGYLVDSQANMPLVGAAMPKLEAALREGAVLERDCAALQQIGETRGFAAADGRTAAELRGIVEALGARLASLRADRERAERVRRTTVEDAAALWETCRKGVREAACYGGYDLPVVEGLVPLDVDAKTGFWRFYCPETGKRPATIASGAPHVDDGLVFVLLPGGKTTLGSPPTEPYRNNEDPNEELVDVTIEPFFIAVYEMTKAQWVRVGGKDRSFVTRGPDAADPRLPIQYVSWDEANAVLMRLGLSLPTEAQWEYAARGGAETSYWWGDDHASISVHECVADIGEPGSDPARAAIRVVGSFDPNPFGLYDVIGNVGEWCRDHYATDRSPDPARLDDVSPRTMRGGAVDFPYYYCRLAFRRFAQPAHRFWSLGVRAAAEPR